MTHVLAIPRRLSILLAALLAAVGLTVAGTIPAHAATAATWYGPYHIQGYVSGKCMEDPGYRNNDGQYLDQWDCVNQWNEQWWLYGPNAGGNYQIVLNDGAPTYNQMCVGENDYNGTIELQLCNNSSTNQLWGFMSAGAGYVYFPNSAYCINVQYNATYNGGRLIPWACANNSGILYNNIWRLY